MTAQLRELYNDMILEHAKSPRTFARWARAVCTAKATIPCAAIT